MSQRLTSYKLKFTLILRFLILYSVMSDSGSEDDVRASVTEDGMQQRTQRKEEAKKKQSDLQLTISCSHRHQDHPPFMSTLPVCHRQSPVRPPSRCTCPVRFLLLLLLTPLFPALQCAVVRDERSDDAKRTRMMRLRCSGTLLFSSVVFATGISFL